MKKNYALLFIPFLLTACVEQNPYSNDPYPPRDCHYYGDCGSRYDRRDDYDRYERERREREREAARRDRDRYRDEHRDDWGYRNDHRDTPRPAPAPKPQETVIRPSCPSGTQYDGRHCKITDSKLKRPGGDGNINPCPKGMWVSGDRCVGK